MNYIKRTLLSNETIVYSTGPHWIIFGPAIAALVIFLMFFMFGSFLLPDFQLFNISVLSLIDLGIFIVLVFQAVVCYIRYASSEYGITNQRIIIKVGFIQRYTLEVLLKRVESIQVGQSITGRLLNFGTVTIRGTGGSRDSFKYVPSPLEFRRIAQQEIAQSQQL